jgi:hypothetical protein
VLQVCTANDENTDPVVTECVESEQSTSQLIGLAVLNTTDAKANTKLIEGIDSIMVAYSEDGTFSHTSSCRTDVSIAYVG